MKRMPQKSVSTSKKSSVCIVRLGQQETSTPSSYSQVVWVNDGETLPDVRRLIAGVSLSGSQRPTEAQRVRAFQVKTYAFSLARSVYSIESIQMNGIQVYRRTGSKQAASRPMACGGRFRLAKSHWDGEVVSATLYMYDVPSKPGEVLEWTVVAVFAEEEAPAVDEKVSQDGFKRDARGRFIGGRHE